MDLHYVQGKALFNTINQTVKQYPYLTEDLETEVVVIGGGVTGSIIAYYFTKAEIPTVLVEKQRMAYGSTGITTALLQYELDSLARDLEQYTSLEKIVTSYKLGIKALDELEEFVKTHGNKCHYEKKDTLTYTNKEIEKAQMEEEYEIRKAAGLPVEFITADNNPFSFELTGGVYAKDGGAQLDPYTYTQHLLEVSVEKGLKAYENTAVTKLEYLEDGVKVHTYYGNVIQAKKVILATGYDTDEFTNRSFGTKTVAYNIATKPVKHFTGWHNKVLIRDNQETYNYYRTTYDDRILAGGEDIPFVPHIFNEKVAQEKYEKLLQRVKNMFPEIENLEIEYSYCGAFASTQDNLGFIGPDPKHKHLWYGLGYGANGILFAILGGMMLSKLYKGEESPYLALFKPDRFDA